MPREWMSASCVVFFHVKTATEIQQLHIFSHTAFPCVLAKTANTCEFQRQGMHQEMLQWDLHCHTCCFLGVLNTFVLFSEAKLFPAL